MIIFKHEMAHGALIDWPVEMIEKKPVVQCPFCSRKVAPVNDSVAIILCAKIKVHVQWDDKGKILNGNPRAFGTDVAIYTGNLTGIKNDD